MITVECFSSDYRSTHTQPVSKPFEETQLAGEFDERGEDEAVELVAYEESAVASQPGEGAFDLPATAIAAKLAVVLSRATDSATAVRADQIPTA
jgi:hypothetical protein